MIKNCSYDVNEFVPHFWTLCSAINEYKVTNSRFISLFFVVVYNDGDNDDSSSNNRQLRQIDLYMYMYGWIWFKIERDCLTCWIYCIHYTVEWSMKDSKANTNIVLVLLLLYFSVASLLFSSIEPILWAHYQMKKKHNTRCSLFTVSLAAHLFRSIIWHQYICILTVDTYA